MCGPGILGIIIIVLGDIIVPVLLLMTRYRVSEKSFIVLLSTLPLYILLHLVGQNHGLAIVDYAGSLSFVDIFPEINKSEQKVLDNKTTGVF